MHTQWRAVAMCGKIFQQTNKSSGDGIEKISKCRCSLSIWVFFSLSLCVARVCVFLMICMKIHLRNDKVFVWMLSIERSFCIAIEKENEEIGIWYLIFRRKIDATVRKIDIALRHSYANSDCHFGSVWFWSYLFRFVCHCTPNGIQIQSVAQRQFAPKTSNEIDCPLFHRYSAYFLSLPRCVCVFEVTGKNQWSIEVW